MPARTIEYMRVADLPDAPRNPKLHATDDIAASVDRFGYVEPIIIDERTGRIVSGHGRKTDLLRRQESGETPPDGIEVDADGTWLAPVSRGWASRSDSEAEAFLIAANAITRRGGWTDGLLVEMLDDLAKGSDGLDGVGFQRDELDALLISTGAAGSAASSFLDDIAASGSTSNPMKSKREPGGVGDGGVDLRLPMTVDERNEAVLMLRQVQRQLGTDSLTSTFLAIVRAWQPT